MSSKEVVFDYALKDRVVITCSGENGEVVGRCDSVNQEKQYLVKYKSGAGNAVENWWFQSDLKLWVDTEDGIT